jgi:RHS repeat-associated protein
MRLETDVDDAYWTYGYDVRYRLTQAQQYYSSDQVLYTFNYTYDKAGNMLTKSQVIPQVGSYYYSYEYNAANELTKETVGGSTVTNFYYDAWGRMMSKAQGSSSATYAYRYGDKLKSVTSNFSGEGNVTYEYGGDLKRRKRQDSSATTQYNWDAGWNVISEENGCGTLTMTYVHDPGKVIGTILADVDSDDPSTGTYRYYFQDNIGSTRRLRNDNKASLGSYEYTPYGQVYLESGATIRYKFTGKEWDDDAKLYYFPFRYYSPAIARWTTRDPLGMVDGPNAYGFVHGNPSTLVDPRGDVTILAALGAGIVGCGLSILSELVFSRHIFGRRPKPRDLGCACAAGFIGNVVGVTTLNVGAAVASSTFTKCLCKQGLNGDALLCCGAAAALGGAVGLAGQVGLEAIYAELSDDLLMALNATVAGPAGSTWGNVAGECCEVFSD